jgi:NitT/TauT family transport system ATP-binding protein
MIQFTQISHQYLNGHLVHALEKINLTIQSGQFIALIGPSGCGKSTLLRLAANLIEPTKGQIHIHGESPQQAILNKRIAWMAQQPALLPWLSVQKNIELALKFQKKPSSIQKQTKQALQAVRLTEAAHQFPNTLSGGMQQRLALARLLVQDADIWLMDEPFAALDELTRENLTIELFNMWSSFQPTVLWVTHNIYEAVKLSDRILVFSPPPGRIIGDITINLSHPRQEDSPEFQKLLNQLRNILHQDHE